MQDKQASKKKRPEIVYNINEISKLGWKTFNFTNSWILLFFCFAIDKNNWKRYKKGSFIGVSPHRGNIWMHTNVLAR